MKYKFKTKPFRHQYDALIRATKQHHMGFLWEPGVAKTKPNIDWASALFMADKLNYVLVAAPLSVLGVWQDEFALHSPLWDWGDVNFIIFDKDTDSIQVNKRKLNVLAINYDLIWRRQDEGPLKHYIKRVQMAIADESHLIKKPSANRTGALWRLNDVPYRSILTGTPTPRSYVDIYAQWKFLNKQRFGTRKEDFLDRYIVYAGFMGKQVKGYLHVKELKKKIRKDASVKTADKCLDLPPYRFQRVPVDLEPHVYPQYVKLAMEFFLELESGEIVDAKNAGVKQLRLQQLLGGWIGTEEGVRQISSAKINALRDLLHTRKEMGEKTVVFARFLPEISAITEVAEKLKLKSFTLTGKVKGHELRSQMRRKFQSMRGAAVFISQIDTGGLGITLHSANEAIFYSVSSRLDSYIQSQKRVHRPGQERPVTYRLLVARNTIENDIYSSLRKKEDPMKILMGYASKYLKQLKDAA